MEKQNLKNTQQFENEFFEEMYHALKDTFVAKLTVESSKTLLLNFLDGKGVRVKVESIG